MKCWYMNGQLLSERTDEYTVTYYDDGAINSEQRKSDGVCIIYSRSGEWIAKTALDDKGLCVPGIDTTEFNERYMAKNYVTMLEDDIENLRYFNIWLMKKSAGSEITVFVQHKLSKIVGNLIRSNDLRVKYEGLNYADKYKLANLAALIRKQLKITNTPSQWNTKDGYGVHGYGFTISQRAERVLDSIKK